MLKKISKIFFIVVITFFMINNVYAADTISCGDGILPIPIATAKIIHTGYILIKISVPLLLIVYGIIDFASAVTGSNEDDIKKKQKKFINRIIAAVVIFLVLAIVELVFDLLAANGVMDATGCIDAILNGDF